MASESDPRLAPLTDEERSELDQLVQTMKHTSPRVSRRDFLRWSAVAAGAVATARFGIDQVTAAPSGSSNGLVGFQDQEIEKKVTINVPFNPFGQAVTLDPHQTVNWGPFWVAFPNVWGGLVRYDENAKVQLDLAESYTVSDDGQVYTFKIRGDAKYASGNRVVADDFIKSWQRALNPSRPSPMSQFMAQIQGYNNYIKKKSDKLGIRAVDDATVEVKLGKPYSFFLSHMASFVWSVVDPKVLDKEGETNFVLKDAGTGPWRFTEFDPSTQFTMAPNKNHYGGNSPSITKIVWPFVNGPDADTTALNLYKKDEAVSADVPLSLKGAVEGDPDLSQQMIKIQPYGSTQSIAMDFKQKPFDDVRVRRAVAMAVDRDKWANEIWEGTWAPATAFTPPVVSATSNYQLPSGLGFNVDEAKNLLKEAGFENGQGLPEITYYEPAEDTDDVKDRWKALLDMIKANIGMEITHDTSKTLEQIMSLQTDNGGRQFDVIWWWNVTETPHLLSDVFTSTSSYMKGVFNWNGKLEKSGDFDPGADSKAFDDLVKKADVDKDEATRNDQYKQAEELALKNAVYVPLGNWVQMYVQKPWLQGTKQGPWTGRLPAWFNKDVVVVKH
ncbi:MAG: peptide ABC transporter substrate-binding protein [Thermomicrobiales bacterium]